MVSRLRVGIIGCGPTGMFTVAAFIRAMRMGQKIPELVCFEKQGTMSGLWNYNWRTGIDGYGEPVHNSMYRNLWTNGPKELLEMGDYTFADHFNFPIPSYLTREVIRDFLMGKAKKYDVSKHVRFTTVVRQVEEEGNQFLVTSQNLKTQKTAEEIFDYVIVATGHYSVPFMPSYPGLDNFNGQIMHSHDFRNACAYKGKSLLMIGNANSGQDIAMQLLKYGAKECVVSYRTKPCGYKFPIGIREVPRLIKFEDGHFHFVDGSTWQADAVIFCTGYLNHYPFMFDNARLRTKNSLYPNNLYKGIIHQNNTRVLYLASQNQYYTFTLFDVQAYWARDYILGKIDIKSSEERAMHMKEWLDRKQSLKTTMEGVQFQSDYISDLMKDTDYPEHGHEKRSALFKALVDTKTEDIMTYRDKIYRSTMTGIMSTPLDKKWVDTFNDPLENYIASAPTNIKKSRTTRIPGWEAPIYGKN